MPVLPSFQGDGRDGRSGGESPAAADGDLSGDAGAPPGGGGGSRQEELGGYVHAQTQHQQVTKAKVDCFSAEHAADYFEDPRASWEDSDHCCPHRQMEAEAERTQTPEADSEVIPEDVPEAEAPDGQAAEEDDAGETEPEERADGVHLGVPGSRAQLELSRTMTTMLGGETAGSFTGPAGDVSSVRRRNKRRKGRKASH